MPSVCFALCSVSQMTEKAVSLNQFIVPKIPLSTMDCFKTMSSSSVLVTHVLVIKYVFSFHLLRDRLSLNGNHVRLYLADSWLSACSLK